MGGAHRNDRPRQVRGHVRQGPGDLTAEPGTDDHGPLVAQGTDHGGDVLCQRHQVVARRRSVRASETAQVEGRHTVPGLSQGGDDMAPGPPALGEAVHQEDEGPGAGRGLRTRQRNMETGTAGGEVAVGPGAGAIDVNRHVRSLLVGARHCPRGTRRGIRPRGNACVGAPRPRLRAGGAPSPVASTTPPEAGNVQNGDKGCDEAEAEERKPHDSVVQVMVRASGCPLCLRYGHAAGRTGSWSHAERTVGLDVATGCGWKGAGMGRSRPQGPSGVDRG